MTSKRILKLLPYLPACTVHLQLECKYPEHLSASEKKTAVLFPEILKTLHHRCPYLKTLILERGNLKMAVKCRRAISDDVEDESCDIITDHDLEQCCEQTFCLGYETPLPPLECLSLRNVKLGKDKEYSPEYPYGYTRSYYKDPFIMNKKFIFPNLKILDLCLFPGVRLPFAYINNICALSNLEEIYIKCFHLYRSNFDLENLFKHAKNLRVFCYTRWCKGTDFFPLAKKYASNLEKVCLCGSLVEVDETVSDDHVLHKLQSLCLRKCRIDQDTLKQILVAYPSLESVNINSTDLADGYEGGINLRQFDKDLRRKIVCVKCEKDFSDCDHFKESENYHL